MVLNSDGTKKPSRKHKPSTERSAPAKPGLQARAAAAKILGAVVDRKLPLDGALDHEHGNPAYRALGESDRALVRAILNTTLRHLPRIDAAVAALLESPLPEGARALHHVLAIGAAQILYLDVPDHSAVDLAVEQANQDPRNRRFAKLVNAVLRRLGREKDEVLAEIGKVAPMPAWFIARLERAYGRDAALAISESQLQPAAIDLTVKSDAEGWAKRLNGVVLPTGGVRLAAFDGGIPSLEGFDEGAWWVQDAAASIPAKLFGDLSGKRAADLCAAPGGKTAQLILAGGTVTALDQSQSRLRRLRSNLDRLGLEAETIAADLTAFEPAERFDAILLDAPCSSTGTTRRHPDVLWTKGPEDIGRLAALQERLLRHALTLLKPDGTLVFSNCSLDPAEGEEVVARVLADTDGIERVQIDAGDWSGLEAAITPLGEFRTLPTMLKMPAGIASGLDGFYAAVLRRVA
ncbi:MULTISPECIES: RsmB/NOP family class I SAM-dependent RNA methyltransferase [unclassified Rhizobium]|uniref:RsmB/NOP family class I SAM-dependent RNA methyltransferase n=1 Tax=unclassified Rhizobium TaxID=2613769 RepID=UPI0007E95F15|nr:MULTISPECIES: RsmB/NOP family class I SAM-dependent RNA methyltransferase [unclassified Rhizobium]ANM12826.1 ribosomal RNA small subunit methyltransferase B [Rhizobium sp. N324]ANM19228.1 ribosomal RNA small subunit methyltransferase B [Rhizobium sp. N541]ANM25613.1 ribosomal RNA small subunit methyltransferase B [Rhizobium sp. N941]OYD02001.1 ribosomal RNA small subunit methyltransferase B [Rhizobium sp. N4311]